MKTISICKITYTDNSVKHVMRIYDNNVHFHTITIHARQYIELKKCGITTDPEIKPS